LLQSLWKGSNSAVEFEASFRFDLKDLNIEASKNNKEVEKIYLQGIDKTEHLLTHSTFKKISKESPF
jgi:hypothetical protein